MGKIESHHVPELPEATYGATVVMRKKYRFLLANSDELNSLIKLYERILQNSHMSLHAGDVEVCCKMAKYAGGHQWNKFRPFWVVLGHSHISIFENRHAYTNRDRPLMLLSVNEFDEA